MLYMSGDSPAPVRLQGVFVSDVEINNIVHYWKSQDSGGASLRKRSGPGTMIRCPHLVIEGAAGSERRSGGSGRRAGRRQSQLNALIRRAVKGPKGSGDWRCSLVSRRRKPQRARSEEAA
jgi:DNA segregation ATPase FtsK/SpoIIIE-like protein